MRIRMSPEGEGSGGFRLNSSVSKMVGAMVLALGITDCAISTNDSIRQAIEEYQPLREQEPPNMEEAVKSQIKYAGVLFFEFDEFFAKYGNMSREELAEKIEEVDDEYLRLQRLVRDFNGMVYGYFGSYPKFREERMGAVQKLMGEKLDIAGEIYLDARVAQNPSLAYIYDREEEYAPVVTASVPLPISPEKAALLKHFNMVDDSDFEEVILKAKGPSALIVTGDWCGPCQEYLKYLSKQPGAKKLNVVRFQDANYNNLTPAIDIYLEEQCFPIMFLPTVIIFRDGKVVGSFKQLEIAKLNAMLSGR